MRRSYKTIVFLLYLVFGIYFINSGINLFEVPDSIMKIDNWIVFIGGIFIILGAFHFLKVRRHNL